MTALNPQPSTGTTTDKQRGRQTRTRSRERFLKVRSAEKLFGRRLNGVAREIDLLVKRFPGDKDLNTPIKLVSALQQYSKVLKPWARETAEQTLKDVDRRDERAWFELGEELGIEIRKQVSSASMSGTMNVLAEEQTVLITSLPEEAAMRVHRLSVEALSSGERASSLLEEIMKTGKVTRSRARLIARTEIGRASTALTGARAEQLGSAGYFWRTSKDSDVRSEHRKLEGKFIPWTSPPIAGPNGERYHAGAGPNCRCYTEPVLPDEV